jgi:UbiD family decarboxylase
MVNGYLNELNDLRDWLEMVRRSGEVIDVEGADWNLEIGAISQLNYRRANPSALLFDGIKGYARGHRVLTGALSNANRLGITLRLGLGLDDRELVERLRGCPARWAEQAAKFEPRVVASAPVFENVIENDINLGMFPVPFWNELDGGRYIGTGCMVITRDRDTGVVNGGAYRMQLQDDGRTATVNTIRGKHGDQHIQSWFAHGEKAPVTVSLGHDPLLLVLAGTEVPTGTSELAYAGAIIGRPLDVVMSEITGLPIPASSEIVIEGWLSPDNLRPEGPFGEWTGYYSASEGPIPALEVARVLYRNNPILLGSPPGKPPHDYSYMRTVMKSAMIHDALIDTGLPGIKGVWAHEAGGGRMFIAVAIEQRYFGHSSQVGHIAAQHPAAAYMNKFVVVVDADVVNPRDINDVVWAMCNCCDPTQDLEILCKTWGSRADPLLVDSTKPYNSRVVINACRPFERIDTFPTVAQPSPELLAKTARDWGHLFREGSAAFPGGEEGGRAVSPVVMG